MYLYSDKEQQLIEQRAEQYRDQTRRYLAGEIPEDEFRILRLQNGLYIQRHAPMLRVAIHYGLLSSTQMRMLADIARKYDKDYAHFTTRQNIQFNWPPLEQVPDILADLAKVQMSAIQTSGSCIRSVSSDHLAGVTEGEIEDPRPWSEIIRQWASLHPEFAYLPRKFKIAVSASEEDRAATQVHDIGVHVVRNEEGRVGFEILVGGGLGRTPFIGKKIRDWVEQEDLLAYLEAILRVYNLHGRRDNKYKSRIKILVSALGIDKFREMVEAEFAEIQGSELTLTQEEIDRVKGFFVAPDYEHFEGDHPDFLNKLEQDENFATWVKRNTHNHKVPGYQAVTVALKSYLVAPGDVTGGQMYTLADIADEFSFGEIRSTHEQNLVLPYVRQQDLYALWQQLSELDLARPVIGTINDMICCPGLDFCSLANAETIGVAAQVQERFSDLDYLYDLGEMKLKMSGCINACAHHHVGNIGILGVDKKGESFYQFMIGGSAAEDASLGKILGKAIPKAEVADTLEKIISVFVENRIDGERFLDTVRRIGNDPFKERIYAAN